MARYSTDNLLPVGLTPGPKSPQNLDSFIEPFLEELKQLQAGVTAYDALTESTFQLKAHLVLVTGDTPAISKLLYLSGHGAKFPCRACILEGTRSTFSYTTTRNNAIVAATGAHYYYPPRQEVAPSRTFESYQRDGQANLRRKKTSKKMNVQGVTGISPLASLSTISVPDCSPFDVMHLVYLGFVRDLCRLLNGNYFNSPRKDLSGVQMPKPVWEAVGADMAKIEAPVSWGRYASFLSVANRKVSAKY